MMNKQILGTLLVLAALMVMLAATPPVSQAQQGPTGENFIFVNFIGQELLLDLDDTQYTVPGTNTMPEGGRLALTLPAGEHKYAANVPAVQGSAGEFTITPGEVVAKAARFDKTSPAVVDGILVEKPRDYVFVFDFDPSGADASPAPVIDNWQPSPAAAGAASLAWVNYTGDELTIDLNGQLYRVPPAAGEIPGRLQTDVDPGSYTFTASIPAGSLNGRVEPVAGQVLALNISANLPPAPDYDIGDDFNPIQPVTLNLYQEDLTSQAVTGAAPAPATPVTTPATLPDLGVAPAAPEQADEMASTAAPGLLIKNYAGDALVFTINNQAITIPNNSEYQLNLPAGEYNYTASLPFVAANGRVSLSAAGQPVELSVATNIEQNHLQVYQN